MTVQAQPRGGGLNFGRILAFLLGALLVLFAVVNLSETKVNFLVFSITVPLFLLIIGTAMVGFVAGVLLRGRGS